MIDKDRLVALLAAFENGDEHPGNPFELESFLDADLLASVTAFALLAVQDTEKYLSQGTADQRGDDREAYVIAGLLQGLHVGFEYAMKPR